MKRFSASSAAQLMACPGSANLELAIPGFIEPVRDEMAGAKGVGTSVHQVLEVCVSYTLTMREHLVQVVTAYEQLHHTKRYPITDDWNKAKAWIIDNVPIQVGRHLTIATDWLMLVGQGKYPPKMLRFIRDAMTYMIDLREGYAAGSLETHGELKMPAIWLESKPYTTADVVIEAGDTLVVIDYKSGSIPVDVVDNDQLMFYAGTAYKHLGSKASFIEMHILQPGNFTAHTVTKAELNRWMNEAYRADQRIINKDLTLMVNDHCTYCPANPRSRGDKGNKMCPVMMAFLYPPQVDEDEVLAM